MILLIYQATIKISLVVKRTFIAILFCIPLTINVIAQNQPKPIEYRFLYGETGLRDYLSRNSTFPANSILNNTIGFSLSSITINPYGAIEDIKILNPIDQFIDKEVTRVLKSSASLWQKCDTINKSQTFYIQIAFIIETWKSDFMILSPVRNIFFMEPVVVSVSRWTSEEALMFQTNELLGVKSNILVNCGRYQESLTFLDELIRRNPFSKELYQFRIMVYRKIGNNDLINKDLRRLTDFAEGLTLDEILKRK
jgi:tetratricopeptide (TPR) repeat protein